MQDRFIRRQPPMPSAPCTKAWTLPIPRPTPRRSSDKPSAKMWIACSKSAPNLPSMVLPWTMKRHLKWGRLLNGAINPDSMMWAGSSGLTTTLGCLSKSTRMPPPSRSGVSAVPSLPLHPSIPGLRAASNTFRARMRCIFVCMRASPKMPNPKS